MLLTALTGMSLTPSIYWDPYTIFFGLLGIGLAASSAGMLNQILEVGLDTQMHRTRSRPLVQQKNLHQHAKQLCFFLALSSAIILISFTNLLTVILTSIAMLGYSWFYTQILKPNTSQNIVIGGLFGAMPPLLGWCALEGSISYQPLILVTIIYTWTPPHFWCLALAKLEDYQRNQIPMLPVIYGTPYTQTHIICYSILLILITQLPYLTQMSGVFYAITANLANIYLMRKMIQVRNSKNPKIYLSGFLASNFYLAALFLIIMIDQCL